MSVRKANRHATVVVIGTRGILIQGASGTGKTQTALELLARHAPAAWLVSDDQVHVEARSGRLVAEAPPTIEGLVEIRGVGPVPTAHEHRALIDLVVSLVEAPGPLRFDPESVIEIETVPLPHLASRAGNPGAAATAIGFCLGLRENPTRMRQNARENDAD